MRAGAAKAAEFATLSEPGSCREYVAVHHRFGVAAADRLLDVACGSALAVVLARLPALPARVPMPRPGWSRWPGTVPLADVQRLDVPFAWNYADPELYGWTLAPAGPAYEAIRNTGEAEYHRAAAEQARGQLRVGLPLRAEINIVGYLARKPGRTEHA
jgi:hypothetical protein